ncbi:MAG: BatD family protein [Myxococcota bacterium]|nr:BatD family protein [Myxococcota bacterium]
MRVLWIAMLMSAPVKAVEVVAELEPAPARAGEQVQLTLRVTSSSRQQVSVEDLGLGKFTLVSTGGTSSSTQMTFSGGQRSVIHSSVLRYVLKAPRTPGAYPLGPVRVRAGTQVGQSAQVPVRVIGAAARVPSAQRAEGDLFVDFSVQPEEPYVGQQFTITAHVYSRVRLEGVSELDYPEAPGIWWEQLDNPTRAGSEVVVYSGRRFRRHMIGRIAGFAERAGELELAGGQAVVQVLQGDMFFGGVKEKTLYANPIQLRVRALPQGVQAAHVGRYRVRHGFIPDRVNLGDVIELKVTVAGDGNIKAFPLPEVRLPPGLRGFTPKREVEMKEGAALIGGELTWTLPIQATVPGKHRLQGLEVRWFDPDKQTERRTIVGPFEFDVVGTLAPTDDSALGETSQATVGGVRGPIGSFRTQRTLGAWLAHPAWLVVVLMLSVMAWWPQRLGDAPTHEEAQRGALELALERALGVPVRGLGREELIAQAQQALGFERAVELDQRLNALDAAAYGPSEQTAEVIRDRLVSWLGEAP